MDMIERFDVLTYEIEAEQNKCLALQNKNIVFKEQMEVKENKLRIDIQNETIEGKPLFSNQEKRDSELLRRLTNNAEYLGMKEEFQKNVQGIKEQEFHVEALIREWSTIKYKIIYLASLEKIKN